MPSIVADTHIIVWFLEEPAKLSLAADQALKNAVTDIDARIFVSAISLIEIQYLVEKQRISTSVLPTLLSQVRSPDPIICMLPVDLSIAENLTLISRDDVPDMPDRIIAVTALLRGLPLITADKMIHASGISVIW